MAYPVTLNGTTYTLADFEGTNYVDGLPNAFEDFVTHAGNTYQTTSTTSITLGTGTLVFTVADSGKPYSSGTPLRISNQADETDYIDALVTTYTGTTLTVNAVGYSGTGTIAAWNINIGGGPITVAGTLPVSQGGTGATTAAAAATALGLGTGDTPTFAGLNVTGTANFGDVNITNVGDISLDTISSDAGTSVTVNLGSDAGDDFIVGSNYLVVEGDTGNVGIGTSSPSTNLHISGTGIPSLRIQDADGSLYYVQISQATGNTIFDARYGASNGAFIFRGLGGGVADEYMRLSTSGNVGIGTPSPSVPIHIYKNQASPTILARFENPDDEAIVEIRSKNTDLGVLQFADPEDSNVGAIQYSHSDNSMRFKTNDSERLRIDSSGNVGIGTSSPQLPLHVYGAFPNAVIQRSSGTTAASGLVLTNTTNNGFYITGSDEAFTIGGVTSYNSSGTFTERMRIDTSGNLLLGTTSAISSGFYSSSFNGATQNGIVLKTTLASTGTDFIRFINSSGSVIGEIEQDSASTVAYLTSSDYRLKTAVTYDWDATTRLKQLRPARFEWIADGDDAVPVDGFLAHEVQTVVPAAISGTKDAMMDEEYEVTPAVLDEDGNEVTPAVMGTRSVPKYQGIDQSKLAPLLTKALIEAVEKIEQLEARIAALEAN
jgi:hypothetical protein